MIKVGLNIGNSKISCAVLEAKENQDFKLLSCESYPSKTLNIIGQVKYPGEYPLAEDMSVTDLISLSGGLTEGAFLDKVEISRMDLLNLQNSSSRLLTLDLKDYKTSKPFPELQAYDLINVKALPEFKEIKTVAITGEVNFPGVYPIFEGEDLKSLVKRAGGMKPSASIKGAFFSRKELIEREKLYIKQLRNDLRLSISRESLLDLNSPISGTTADNLRAKESLLVKLDEMEPNGRLIISLDDILFGNNKDIYLKDGDRLFIPSRVQSVTVIGEVHRPSSYLHNKRYSVLDYVELSGGFKDFADTDSFYIVRSSGEVITRKAGWLRRNKVQEGDTIIVPMDYEMKKIPGWQVATNVSSIIYQLALGSAAVRSFNRD